ncbi:voltage-gated potassium channel [Exidia glandulosa HHB12029]|uniref:Voltage-gated potassium channel n=1 Tax=Exidia glandulosa HHB12029 TaxID=1314781 RepID=A0A165BD47_EXIGL|nr:voltage-gated potassium channel [Exidia glandulosa HHB12029]
MHIPSAIQVLILLVFVAVARGSNLTAHHESSIVQFIPFDRVAGRSFYRLGLVERQDDTCTVDCGNAPNLGCASHGGVHSCDPIAGDPDPSASATVTGSISTPNSSASSTSPVFTSTDIGISSGSTASTPTDSNAPAPPSVTTSASPSSTADPATTPTFTPTPGRPAAPPGASLTSVPNSDPRIIYSPPEAWQSIQESSCDGDSVKRSTTVGSKFSFSFNGTSVALLTATSLASGVYQVVIQDANLLPERSAVVDGSTSSASSCSTGFATTGLGDGIHTITVTIMGASPQSASQGTALDFNSIQFSPGGQTQDGSGTTGSGTGDASGLCFVFILDFVASTTLVVRFLATNARRSTLVTVLSLCTSLTLSIISGVTFGHDLSLHELSTTFWVAVGGACNVLVALVLLVWEVIRTRRYLVPLTRIAVKQRSLVITFYVFVMYLTLGAIIFKFASNLIYLDAIFFVIQSVLTCGFGDITPPNLGSRLAAMLFFPVAIVFVGVLISEIRETLLTTAKQKFVQKVSEKTSDMGPDAHEKAERSGLIPRQRTEVAKVMEEGKSYEANLREAIRALQKENARDYTHELVFAFSLFFVFWLIGALGFSRLEGFNYFMSLYFTFIAFSSIGYGELSPETSGGRAFYIGWGMLGIVCLTILFSVISDAWLNNINGGLRRFLSHRMRVFKRRKREEDASKLGPKATPSEKKQKKEAEPVANIVRDLRAHLNAMLQQDHTSMRTRLKRLFDEQSKVGVSGEEEEKEEVAELHDAMLDDDDQTVMLLLLKHCDYQLQKLVTHIDENEEQRSRGHDGRPDSTPDSRERGM